MLNDFLYRHSLFMIPIWSAATVSLECIDTVNALQKEKDR